VSQSSIIVLLTVSGRYINANGFTSEKVEEARQFSNATEARKARRGWGLTADTVHVARVEYTVQTRVEVIRDTTPIIDRFVVVNDQGQFINVDTGGWQEGLYGASTFSGPRALEGANGVLHHRQGAYPHDPVFQNARVVRVRFEELD
jgi:hypothetical protein